MALICLLLDSTNQPPGRSYTCSVRDTIDQRQTTFPSIRSMQKYGRSYEDDFQLKILWWVGIGKWLEVLCIFSWHRMLPKPDHFEDIQSSKYVFSYLSKYFSNAIFGGQFISVELLHCGRPRECKRRHFLFRLITCLVTKPQYYSSLLSNKPGNFSKAGHFIFAKHSIFWQTFCQCYDCPAYLNTIHFGPYIFNFGQSRPS